MFTHVFFFSPNQNPSVFEVTISLPSGLVSGDGTFSTGNRRRLDEEERLHPLSTRKHEWKKHTDWWNPLRFWGEEPFFFPSC